MMNEIVEENLIVRMMAYSDFQEFKRACLASPIELTEYLDFGREMEFFLFTDFWNLFNFLLKDPKVNVYGLFRNSELVAVGTCHVTDNSRGYQIVGWVRSGNHGKKYGQLLLEALTERCLITNNADYVELIIDQENQASSKVARNLEYEQIHKWEHFNSGQGQLASGRFTLFMKFHPRLVESALREGIRPMELLEMYWIWEEQGLITRPSTEIRRSKSGKTRLAQNLRFIGI